MIIQDSEDPSIAEAHHGAKANNNYMFNQADTDKDEQLNSRLPGRELAYVSAPFPYHTRKNKSVRLVLLEAPAA
jgi:hypothetical protein